MTEGETQDNSAKEGETQDNSAKESETPDSASGESETQESEKKKSTDRKSEKSEDTEKDQEPEVVGTLEKGGLCYICLLYTSLPEFLSAFSVLLTKIQSQSYLPFRHCLSA